jgi:hypothetical protein
MAWLHGAAYLFGGAFHDLDVIAEANWVMDLERRGRGEWRGRVGGDNVGGIGGVQREPYGHPCGRGWRGSRRWPRRELFAGGALDCLRLLVSPFSVIDTPPQAFRYRTRRPRLT